MGEGFSDQAMHAALRAVHLSAEVHSGAVDLLSNVAHNSFQNLDSPVSEHGKVSILW